MGGYPARSCFQQSRPAAPEQRGQRRRVLRLLQLTSFQQVDPERWKRSAATLSGMECQQFFRREAPLPRNRALRRLQLFNLGLCCRWKLSVEIEVKFQDVNPGLT